MNRPTLLDVRVSKDLTLQLAFSTWASDADEERTFTVDLREGCCAGAVTEALSELMRLVREYGCDG